MKAKAFNKKLLSFLLVAFMAIGIMGFMPKLSASAAVATAPKIVSAKAFLTDDTVVDFVGNTITLELGDVLEKVEVIMDKDVLLGEGTPKAKCLVNGVEQNHSLITVDATNHNKVIVTPISAVAGTCATVGDMFIRVPADSVMAGTVGNAETIIILTVTEPVAPVVLTPAQLIWRDIKNFFVSEFKIIIAAASGIIVGLVILLVVKTSNKKRRKR